jgi:crotonobetainyl-CoA:carnitine CoA-transferase CaiB-like acyl-CoA transferase
MSEAEIPGYRGPLTGLRILDLTRVLAGPYGAMQLADLGAEVIKVEDVVAGDFTRQGPPFVNGVGAYFNSLNRDKRSVAIDLKDPRGLAQFRALVDKSDIVLENFAPGVMDRLGIGYDALAHVNPGVILCSISGFGQNTAFASRPAFDLVIQAQSGIMATTGAPGDAPTRVGLPIADIAGGIFAAIGILAAVHERTMSGRGQWIDVSMLDVLANMMVYYPLNHLAGAEVPQRMAMSRHMSAAPWGVFETADGHLVVAVMMDQHWAPFCRAIERPELIDDDRFADWNGRSSHQDELYAILDDVMRSRPTAEWEQRLEEARVAHGAVLDVPAMTEHPVLRERDMFVEVEHPVAGPMQVLGRAIKLPGRDVPPVGPAPLHGQHTREVLTEIAGTPLAEVLALEEAGVVVQSDLPSAV